MFAATFKAVHVRALWDLVRLALLVAAVGVGIWMLSDDVSGHGTCATHHEYRTYDGTHDADGDGVGCESLPPPPSGDSSSGNGNSDGYDRDNWSFNSSSARAELSCSSSEHVDHVVALKEAYDSGAANWTNRRKAQFANDLANLWCLEASVNISKSDHDLAEWGGGTCTQRKYIARVTKIVKAKYELTTDAPERVAIAAALEANCHAANGSGTSSSSTEGALSTADGSEVDPPTGRIVARRLDNGKTEFGFQPIGGDLILPRLRFFPADARVDRWLYSSQVTFEGRSIGWISARLLDDGRIEFSFIDVDKERILPRARYFPRYSSGKWLESSLIDPAD